MSLGIHSVNVAREGDRFVASITLAQCGVPAPCSSTFRAATAAGLLWDATDLPASVRETAFDAVAGGLEAFGALPTHGLAPLRRSCIDRRKAPGSNAAAFEILACR